MSAPSLLTEERWEKVAEWVHDGISGVEICRKIQAEFNITISQSGLSRAVPYRSAQKSAQKAQAELAKSILERNMAANATSIVKMMNSLMAERDRCEVMLADYEPDGSRYRDLTNKIETIDKSYSKYLSDYNDLYQNVCILAGNTVSEDDKKDTIEALLGGLTADEVMAN